MRPNFMFICMCFLIFPYLTFNVILFFSLCSRWLWLANNGGRTHLVANGFNFGGGIVNPSRIPGLIYCMKSEEYSSLVAEVVGDDENEYN